MKRLVMGACALLMAGCTSGESAPAPPKAEPLKFSAIAYKAQPAGPVTLRAHTVLDGEHRRLRYSIAFGDGSPLEHVVDDQCGTASRPHELPRVRHTYVPNIDYTIQAQVTATSCQDTTRTRAGATTATVIFMPRSATPAEAKPVSATRA